MKRDIIRINDVVQVTNPLQFERCGYPLVPAMELEAAYKDHFDDVCALVAKVEQSQNPDLVLLPIRANNPSDLKVIHAILCQLSYVRCRAKAFGGNERRIYTTLNNSIRHWFGVVCGKRVVYTGTRVPGYNSPSYPEDNEPPAFTQAKPHVILRLRADKDIHHNSDDSYLEFEIEAANVRKVGSVSDWKNSTDAK